MASDQLPDAVREFASYLDGLLARLDQGGGWCAVFWRRDPDGMRACLDGREVPPWDVVEALLQDLAAEHGPEAAAPAKDTARSLYAAALAAHDARPGAREILGDRLDVMLREQKYAAERLTELGRLLTEATTRQAADALRLDLAWARDDHTRATARCAELRTRLAGLNQHASTGPAYDTRAGAAEATETGTARPTTGPAPQPGPGTPGSWASAAPHSTAGAPRLRPTTPASPAASGAGHGVAGEPYPPSGASNPGAPAPHPRPRHEAGASAPGSDAAPGPVFGAGPAAHPRSAADASAPGSYTAPASASGAEPAPHPYSTSAAPASAPGSYPAPAPHAAPPPAFDAPHAAPPPALDRTSTPTGAPTSTPPANPTPTPVPTPTPTPRKRRRGGARFAGAGEDDVAPVVVPPSPAPLAPAPVERAGRPVPRGARFAGVGDGGTEAVVREPADAGAAGAVAGVVEALVWLRGEGRGGEAHVVLAEVAYWAPARFPLLAAEMERAGLAADWATLLWEIGSLPADRLVAVADVLAAAGRSADGQQVLRQGVARPAAEIGQAVLGLVGEGRRREAHALLDAYVGVRTPEEAARSAAPGPQTLVPLLLEAAGRVSADRHRDLVHALRVAGVTA
ncbi:hypothetical protein SUDANB105_01396 [Streptomyces sp. enrichment culture]|uniref:hypothetical protein n=1 Tax=Streptomyces sp. enrichment culture TaxID=1795815 RepID=UPI003F56390F